MKDIEIVAQPLQEPADLFGNTTVAHQGFCAVVNQWPKVKGQPTGKNTQRRLPEGIMLDLFIADADNWGLTLVVRTGSADFSHHVLASGWVKAGYTSLNGHLYRRGERIPVREEADLFTLLQLPWVEPRDREVHTR